jgi:Fe-S cluster assembly protein SufD
MAKAASSILCMTTFSTEPQPKTFVPSVFLDAPRWNHVGVPAWFAASQLSAWKAFTELAMPGRRDEHWRFANVGALRLDAFKLVSAAAGAETCGLTATAAQIVFANGAVATAVPAQQKGLEVLSLSEALAQHGDRVREWLVPPATGLGGEKFSALHHAQLQDAVVVIVADGVDVADPIEIVHALSGTDASTFPRTLVLAGARSKVTILERHVSSDAEAGFLCGATQIKAGAGAHVSYTQVSRLNIASRSMHFSTVDGSADSQVTHAIFNLGSGHVRTEAVSRMAGKGSRCDMLSVSLTSESQEVDQRTLQDHLSPHTQSDLLYKNVLFGTSRTVFSGLIKVAPAAHFTDAYQKCRNLLLSTECEANSMPGLEINADQVKCSHGSTSGRLNPEEVFYLQARGIAAPAAGRMISFGFAAEVVSKVGHPAVEAFLTGALEERFSELDV